MTSQVILKKRDHWENQVKIAYEQSQLCKRNFHIFDENTKDVLKRYEAWLQRHKLEPTINLNHYK